MNSIWKRSLAMFLSIVMVFGMLPVNAFATGVECEHSYVSEVTKEATCEDVGETTYTCELCGDVYTEEISATGHAWGEGVATAATCTEDGYTTYTCGNCGTTKTEGIIAATGHDMVDGACTVCGEPEETEDDSTEESSEAPAECNCKVKCNEKVNSDCPVCGAGDITACTGKEPEVEPEVDEQVVAVQAMIDALRTTINAGEEAEAQAEYDAVTVAIAALTDEQRAQLDMMNYDKAAVPTVIPVDEGADNEAATYAELVAALEAGQKEIKITGNFTIDTKIKVPDGTTIDLNGCQLTLAVENSTFGDVTIKDSTDDEANHGIIFLAEDDVHVCDGYFLVNADKTLTLDNITVSTKADEGYKGYTVFHLYEKANLVIENKTSVFVTDNEYAGSIVYAGNADSEVTIDDSTVYGENCGRGFVYGNITLTDAYVEICGTEEGGLEHGFNRSTLTVNDSEVKIYGGYGRGITAETGDIIINGSSTVEITDMTEATIELRGNKSLSVADTATVTVDSPVNNTTAGTITGTVNDGTASTTYVAQVGEVKYTDLQEAIVAAAPNGTVELLSDVTVDKWIMFSEKLSIGSGQIITIDIDGLTINGNDHTLTIKDIESASNGNRLFYDATKLNIKDLTIEYVDAAANLGGICLTSGEISNVKFIGGCGVFPGTGDITVTGCTFKTNGDAFYNEHETDKLVVTGNTFELGEDTNVILLRGDVTFTGNTIVSGRTVNVVSGSPVVTGNDFNDVRVKVYEAATATISKNEINNLVFEKEDVPTQSTFTENTLSVGAQAALDKVTASSTTVEVADLDALIAALADETNDKEIVVTETIVIPAGQTVVLDLNGKTVSMVYSENATANHEMIHNYGNLTIQDSGENGKLSYKYTGADLGITYAANTITTEPGSVLTVESGTIENLTFDSGTIAYAIDGRTNGGAGDVTVNIKGGTITSLRQSVRIFANSTTNTGALNISGGEITGRVIIQNANANANKAALEITGGTFNANSYKTDVLYVGGSNGATIDMEPVVSNGTFNGEITSTMTSGFITGGTFTTDVTDCVADGYEVTANTDGTYGVAEKPVAAVAKIGEKQYTSLDTAFAEAVAGDIITLLADATPTLTSQSAITKASTIDLGGKTLTLTEDDLYFGTTTFKNGTIVVAPTVKASTAVFWMFANQTLIFDDVDIVATGVTGTYLIGINGGTGSAVKLINGSKITINNEALTGLGTVICDNGTGNSVVIENSTIDVDKIDGRFYLGGTNGTITVKDSNIDLDGVKEGFYLRAGQKLSVEGTSNVDIDLNSNEGRYGINMEAASATYTKADTATVNGTVYKAPVKVTDKASLDAAIAAAQPGDVITLANDIVYGNPGLMIEKAITLDLGGHTLTTTGVQYSLALKNDGIVITNGKLNHAGTVAAIKVWNAKEISDLEIDVTGTSSKGNDIGGIVIQQNAAGVDTIKNVKIYSTAGQGIANGIETSNCGNATEPVIGSMENVTIDAVGTAMNISAPCGTATNCSFNGGKNGIEIWIKGTYSASLTLEDCDVTGGVYAHDEFKDGAVNNGTLNLTVDANTTGASAEDVTLTIMHNSAVDGVLEEVMDNAVATVGNTYYATLEAALKAVTAENNEVNILKDITITEDWDCRSTGAKFTVPVVINGNDKTIKFTGNISDKNWDTAFRFESDATINDLIIDMSEIANTGKYRAITAAGNLTVDGCKFIGKASANGRAIIFGEGAGANVGNLSINVIWTEFINWTRGLTDNENGQDVKTVYAKKNTFTNASVFLSAAETINFNDNTVTGGEVDLRSYAKADTKLSVNANGNALDATQENVITNAATVNAQPEFKIAPKGTITYGYTDQTNIWGEASGNAKESFVIKVYAGDILMATTNLNNVGGIIDGDVTVTWHNNFVGNFDEFWTTTWEAGYPNKETQPTTVKLFVDGQEVAENVVKMNGPDNVYPVVWGELDIFKPDVAQLEDANGNVIGTYKDFESALAAAIADETVTRIEILEDFEATSVANTDDYYTIDRPLTIGAPEGEEYTVTVPHPIPGQRESLSLRVQGNGASLTIEENVTFVGLEIVANGFWTNNENLTIAGNIKASSLKQWTSNGTITISETGKVELGYGDGQFSFNYGNGTVNITGNGDKTAPQFKAGYSDTQSYGNGNTLNLKDTYFEGGAWFNLNGSNGTINADNALLKVSGGDGAGSMTIASSGNVINLTNGSELAVANLTIGAGNTVKLDKTSSVEATKITGAGTIQINAADMKAGDVVDVNADLSGFTGKLEVVNNDLAAEINENGEIVLVAVVAKIGDKTFTTLAEAIDAANADDEIVILSDIAEADVTINKAVTLNLGGKTLTDAYIIVTADVTIKNGAIKNTNEPYPLVVQNGGKLTVEDVAIEASKSDRAIWVRSGSSLIFESGSILATKGEGNTKTNLITAIYTDTNTDVTINGGTITVDTPDNKAVGIFGNYTNANVTVNGGKISTSGKNYSYGINVDGNITVTGGEIVTNEKGYGYSSGIRYGNNYALVTALGDVTVTGGKITTNSYSGYMVNVGRTYSSKDQTITISNVEFTNNLSEVEQTSGGHKAPVLIWEGSASNVTATITGGIFNGVSADLLRGENTDLTISGGKFSAEIKDEYLAEGLMLTPAEDNMFEVVEDPAYGMVAKIGDSYYATLAEALTAADNGDTVTLISGDTVISMAGSVCGGKTVTITGNAIVDWTKGNLWVGREGEGDGKVIFDDATITSSVKKNPASTGIHVSGNKASDDKTNNGVLVIKNSNIELDYLINRNETVVEGNSTLTVYGGCYTHGRNAAESGGEAKTATLTIETGSTVNVINENGMGVGGESNGIMTVRGTYNANVLNVSSIGVVNVEGGSLDIDGSVVNNGTINVSGESTLNVETLTGNTIDLLNGAIVEDSTVGGDVFVAGNVTFRGDNTFGMLTDFGTLTDYYGTTAPMKWTVEEDASVTLTDKARYGLGYGDEVTIYGSIEDAMNARNNLTDDDISLFMHGLVAQESPNWNCNSSLNVKNAYVVIGSNNSFGNKPGNYGGNYNIEIENSVVNASRITFYEANSKTEFTFKKSDVETGTFMTRDADSIFTLTDTKLLSTTTTNGTDEGNYNAGQLNLVRSQLTYSAPFDNKGTVTLGAGSSLTAPSITGDGKIVIDATGMKAGDIVAVHADLSGFTGAYEVINNPDLYAELNEKGELVLKERATIMVTYADGSVAYFSDILEAVPYTTNYDKLQGATVKLMEDITAKGIRFMETDMVLDLNGHTYTINNATGSSGSNTSGFQIREDAAKVTIKNGTIKVAKPADMVENTNVVWMFNSYSADFTVEDVTVDCTNMAWSYGESCYVHVSRPGDNTNFTGTTKIVGFDSTKAGNAINVGGTMTIDDTADITGLTVELDVGATLTAKEGLTVVAPVGYGVKYENGVYSTIKYVAKIGDSYYATLAEALAAVGAGDVVIELLDDAQLDYNAREAYGTAETTSLTINGAGKTLTLNQKDSDWSSIGLANADAKLVLNNMTIDKIGYGDTDDVWNTHSIIISNNVEMTDVTVNQSMTVENGATLNNVIINEANGYYGLYIAANGQTVTMTGGSITATNGGRGIKVIDQYADAPEQVTLNVTGTKFTTAEKAAVLVTSTAGAKITASNVDITNVAADNVNFVWNDEERGAYYGKTEVTGGTLAQEAVEIFVASIGIDEKVEGYYKTLADAIAAVSETQIVTLLQNSNVTTALDKAITLVVTDNVTAKEIKLTNVNASITTETEGMNVTPGVDEYMVAYEDGMYKLVTEAAAWNTATGYKSKSVSDVLMKAQPGQTVELLRDCSDSLALVPVGVTLDLKGYDLTVGYLPVFGEIADSTDGQGSVIVAANSATFTATNKQMPLYDGSAYRFFNYSFRVGGGRMQSNNTSVKFGAGIDFDNVVAYDLIQAADNAGLTVGVKLRWDNESRNYNFQNATIQTYGSSKEGKPAGNFMLTFTVHGVNEIAGKTLYMDYIFTSYGVGDQCTCEITIPATE